MDSNHGDIILVADVMDPNPLTVAVDTKLDGALEQMSQKQCTSCVVLDDNGKLHGCLEADQIRQAKLDGKKRKTLEDLLTEAPLTFGSELELPLALDAMKQRGLAVALVVDGSKLVGELRLSRLGSRLSDIMSRKDKVIAELRLDRERKDEYLGLVSHDMRAPLTVIALSSDYLLADESVRSLTDDQKSFIERIQRNGNIASSMIHDILDVVRLDRGFRLDFEEIQFTEFLKESIQNLDVMGAKKKITFQVTYDQDVKVIIDPKRMRQVIENLLINAIKFSPQGGQIFIRSGFVEKNGQPTLFFQVRDQGQGIRKEDEARIFEAFVQSGRPKIGTEGVGLGLAIVRKFIEFHQGSIELDGGWQKGASITVFVPNASLIAPAALPIKVPQGPVVLLVEDDESIREFYKQSLEDCRFHVLEAGDGAEGFAQFQQHHVDLVLSDIRMPKVDGLELLARIRMTGSKVPVILCSGYYVGLENDLSGSEHKPNRIIDKPFKVKDMVAAIEDLLHRYKQAS